jgi:hypothetical protein
LDIADGVDRDEEGQQTDDAEKVTCERVEPEMEGEIRQSERHDGGGGGFVENGEDAGNDRGQRGRRGGREGEGDGEIAEFCAAGGENYRDEHEENGCHGNIKRGHRDNLSPMR